MAQEIMVGYTARRSATTHIIIQEALAGSATSYRTRCGAVVQNYMRLTGGGLGRVDCQRCREAQARRSVSELCRENRAAKAEAERRGAEVDAWEWCSCGGAIGPLFRFIREGCHGRACEACKGVMDIDVPGACTLGMDY